MKKVKILGSAVLIVAISFICSPSSIAEPYDNTNEPAKAVSSMKAKDEEMLIAPKYNCDPKMLIPGNPDIDPEFLLKLPSQE